MPPTPPRPSSSTRPISPFIIPLQAREDVIAKYRTRNTGDVNPIYCAMVESADDSMGQLMRALDESGQAANTIVVFFSDNGGVRLPGHRAGKPVTNNAHYAPARGICSKAAFASRS